MLGSTASAASGVNGDAAGQGDDASSADIGAIQGVRWRLEFHAKPSVVMSVVEKINSEQRRVIAASPFGGFLHLKNWGQVDRKFAFWIIQRVDPALRVIVTGDGTAICLDEALAEDVLGLGGGEELIPFPHEVAAAGLMADVSRVLGLSGVVFSKITISILQDLLLPPVGPMTNDMKKNCGGIRIAV